MLKPIEVAQTTVATRYSSMLQDPVASYPALIRAEVPRLKTLRLDPIAHTAFRADIDALIAAQSTGGRPLAQSHTWIRRIMV